MPGEAPSLGGCKNDESGSLTSKDPVHQKLIIPSPLLYSLLHLVLCKQLSTNQTNHTKRKPIYFTCILILWKFRALVYFTRRLHTHIPRTSVLTYWVPCVPFISCLKFTEMFWDATLFPGGLLPSNLWVGKRNLCRHISCLRKANAISPGPCEHLRLTVPK